ncbi:MAG: ABC-type transporter Mla maintaining outer membrane lipid asymmetry permease subunit MlaE [Cognaticolwellia sp.]|jgi:ABC-type transporter Mla maintaining outer membrane lipid asymmetry permease subunit MlaE
MDPLRSLGQAGLSTWNTLGSLHQLVIGVGVQAWQGPNSTRQVREVVHRVGVQGGSTAIVVASVAGMLMIGLPLAFLGEYALQQPAGGLLGLPAVRVLAPVVAAATVAGRLQIKPNARPLAEQAYPPVVASVLSTMCLFILAALAAIVFGYGAGGTMGGQSYSALFHDFATDFGFIDLAHGLAKAALFGLVVGVIRAHQSLIEGQPRGALRAVLACILLDGLLNLPWLMGLL